MTEMFTGLLAEIAEVAGPEAAEKVAAAAGGTRISIPPRAIVGHWLSEAVGLETADAICCAFAIVDADDRLHGISKQMLPLGPVQVHRRARALALNLIDNEGLSVRDAARAVGVHERTVWRALAVRKNPNAYDMKKAERLIRQGQPDREVIRSTKLKPQEIRALREKLSKKGKV